MGLAEAITRRPLAVVAIWIIVAVAAAPLFARLSSVVKEQQYSLPPSSETRQAEQLMSRVLSGHGGIGVIVVTGVNLDDNGTVLKLVEWGRRFNESVSSYMRGVSSLPLMLAAVNESLYKAMLQAVNMSAGNAARLYAMLEQLDQAYASALENASRQVRMLNQSVRGLMEADKGYVEAYRSLLSLAAALNRTMEGLARVDLALENATDSLLEVAARLNGTATGLAGLDQAYSSLYHNLSRSASRLRLLLSNRTAVNQTMQLIAYTWWQLGRAYYYLELYNGSYQAYARVANLTQVSPRLAPLPRKEAIQAWRGIASMVRGGADPDTAALKAAVEALANQTPGTLRSLLPVLAGHWAEELSREKRGMNISEALLLLQPPPMHVKSQLRLLQLAQEAASRAAESVASHADEIATGILAGSLEEEGLPRDAAEKLARLAVEGRLRPLDAAEAVAAGAAARMRLPGNATSTLARLLVEEDPGANGTLAASPERSMEAAARLLEQLGAPAGAVEAAEKLLRGHGGRREAARLAAELLQQRLPAEARGLVPLVLQADPEARGLLAKSPEELARLAAELVYREAAGKGARMPRDVVEELARLVARGEAGPSRLRELALELVERQAAGRMGAEKAQLVVEALRRYDPGAQGLLASNETLAAEAVAWMVEKQGKRLPFTPEQLVEMLHSREALKRIVAGELRRQVLARTPENMTGTVEGMLDTVIREGPVIPAERKWSLVEEMLEKGVRENIGRISVDGLKPPSWLPGELARLAVEAARNETSVEGAARLLAERLLLGSVYPKLLRSSEGLLVSRDHHAFTVMGEPLGSTQDERAGNTEAAGRLVEELLDSMHIAHGKVYVSGSDLLLSQVKKYAREDVEKTSGFSEIGTFIVLLVILESVFAVILPYIGIFLGLLVGGAIIYLAASHGIVSLDSQTHALMMTTALGLGADYAAYLVHRFREEYAKLEDAREAARRALRRAGPAIVASALTVIIGFGSLLLGWEVGFLRRMGENIPVTVAATAAASLTLVPALLALLGGRRWFWWPRRPSRERHVGRESRVMRLLTCYEAPLFAVLALLIIVSGHYYVSFKGTHDMKLMLPESAPALQAFNVLSEEFAPGITDPVYVAAVLPHSVWEDNSTAAMLDGLVDKIAEVPGVYKVLAPTRPHGVKVSIGEAARSGGRRLTSSGGRVAVIQVILGVDPYSREGQEAVEEIHRVAHSYASSHGFTVYVGGAPYGVLEMDELLHKLYYHRILPAAALLMILVFTVVFGSLVAAVVALTVIIGAAVMGIAASILLFQDLLGKPVLWFLNIVAMMAVLGVGMDYNSFFLARALEECHLTGCDPKKSVARAAGAVSLFIIGLSLVVTVAYASMMTASNTGMREMGFTLASTVLLAGLMASYLLTPLAISLLGRAAWWPWGMKKRIEH